MLALTSGTSKVEAADSILQPYQSFSTGVRPLAVAVGDLNGDGRTDAVLTTRNDEENVSDVWVFLQDAAGKLSLDNRYLISPPDSILGESIAVADVNDDGRDDVVIPTENGLGVMLQNVGGKLDSMIVYPDANSSHRVAVGDFNGDGLVDAAAIAWGSNRVSVFLQKKDGGGFSLPASAYDAPHGGGDDLKVGDVTNDGRDDIVVMSGQLLLPNFSVLAQAAGGGLLRTVSYSYGGSQLGGSVAIGDINGDGLNDVALSVGNAPETISPFLQNAQGALGKGPDIQSWAPQAMQFGDMDGDGRADLVIAGDKSALRVFLHGTNGAPAEPLKFSAPTPSSPHALAIGDVNGDGAEDVLLAGAGLGDIPYGLAVFSNRGFSSNSEVSAQLGVPFSHQVVPTNGAAHFAADSSLLNSWGLALDPASGLISGTPTQLGSLSVVVSARNGSKTVVERLSIIVLNPAPTTPTPTPAPTPAPMSSDIKTGLSMLSEPGNYVGQGMSYLILPPAYSFTLVKNSYNGVTIHLEPSGSLPWTLDFAAADALRLKPGVYLGAQRFYFQEAGAPGMSISGEGRGSQVRYGSFVVKDVVYSGDTIDSFWATFVQGDVIGGPALTGEIRYNANVPEDVDPKPTPTPETTPTPTATPAPNATPTPVGTPAPEPLPDETSSPPAGYDGPRWVDQTVANGIACFLFASPTRIERFDLENQIWLPTMKLFGTAAFFTADAEAFYVGLSSSGNVDRFVEEAWNYNRSATRLFSTLIYGTCDLVVNGNVLYVRIGQRITSVNKNVAQTLSVKNFSYALQGFSIAHARNALFARTQNVIPAGIVRIDLGGDGSIGDPVNSPAGGVYPDATRTYMFPDEERVADNAGIIYKTSDLTYAGSLAGGFDDMDFDGGRPVVLRGRTLVAYSEAGLETGRLTLNEAPKKIAVHDGKVFAFYSADDRGVWVMKAPLASFRPAKGGQPPNPEGLAFSPDAVEFDDGVVYLLNKADHSVFRWSLAQKSYQATISLPDSPSLMEVSPADHRLYVGYPSGRISYFSGGLPGEEISFANLPQGSLGLSAAGERIFAVDPSGTDNTHYVFGSDGRLLSSRARQNFSKEYVWSPANRSIYFFRDKAARNGLVRQELDSSGQLGVPLDSPDTGEVDFVHPIRISPDGSKALTGSGRIFDGHTLAQNGMLPTEIVDATWLGDRLFTIRISEGATQVQEWSAAYAPVATREIVGRPLRIFPSGNDILVVSSVDGKPAFHVMDHSLTQVFPTPTPEGTPTETPSPTPGPTATPQMSPSSSPFKTPKPDRQKPTLEIYGGLRRFTARSSILIGGRVSDNAGVASVTIKSRGGHFRKIPSRTYWITNPRLEKGKNVFVIRATDSSGNFTEARVSITKF